LNNLVGVDVGEKMSFSEAYNIVHVLHRVFDTCYHDHRRPCFLWMVKCDADFSAFRWLSVRLGGVGVFYCDFKGDL
jgi:hypothetical protein